jgi:mannose-6-phosphate isomerase-like protein (cupin superfamily)
MTDFYGNIEKLTLKNKNYRKVLATTKNMQLVLMSLKPLEEIGTEVHKHTSQFMRIEKGSCVAIIGSKKIKLKDDDFIIIPPNTKHNIINNSKTEKLKLYSIYTPPEHKPGLIQKRKDD